MDENGIWAQVVYPNVLGFAGQGRGPVGAPRREPVDADLRLVSTQIYNDAMAELQRDSGDRLLPMILVPWWDIQASVAEIERCQGFGMRGVVMCSNPQDSGTPEFNHWVGLLFWIPAIAGGIFGLLGGYLTDRLGRRRVLTWSILIYAFSAFAAGLSTSIGWRGRSSRLT